MKNIYKVLFSCAVVASFSSCTNEQDDIFGQSSAERLNAIKGIYTEKLCDSENGWLMEYFPNDTAVGVNFIMKFEKSGLVNIGTKNQYQPSFATEESLFEIITDNGPVLTFNTYNNLFHLFSNPEDPNGGTALDGLGLEGDYEFIVLKENADGSILLKGKKRATYINLIKYPVGRQWSEYFSVADDLNSKLFGRDGIVLSLKKGNEVVSDIHNAYKGKLRLCEPGTDIKDIVTGTDRNFITNTEGIRLYSPLSVDGVSENFIPNADFTKLVSKENPEVTIEGPSFGKGFTTLLDALLASSTTSDIERLQWNLDIENCGDAIRNKVQELIDMFAVKTLNNVKYEFEGLILRRDRYAALTTFSLAVKVKNYKQSYLIPFSCDVKITDDNKAVISFPDPLVYNATGNNVGANFFKAGFTPMFEIPSCIEGEYNLTTSSCFVFKDLMMKSDNGGQILMKRK